MITKQKIKIRTFLSVNLSDDEKISLSKRVNKFKILNYVKTQTKVKLINPLNYHLTIAFLGSVSTSQLKKLKSELNALILTLKKPIECKINGLGAFPNIKAARLIFLNIESKELMELAEKIRKIVIKNGFKLDHEFKSHITIARFKDKIELNDLDNIHVSFSIDSFYLMQSILTSAGPLYSKLERFNLVIPSDIK